MKIRFDWFAQEKRGRYEIVAILFQELPRKERKLWEKRGCRFSGGDERGRGANTSVTFPNSATFEAFRREYDEVPIRESSHVEPTVLSYWLSRDLA